MYQQFHGTAMGFLVSEVIANLVMELWLHFIPFTILEMLYGQSSHSFHLQHALRHKSSSMNEKESEERADHSGMCLMELLWLQGTKARFVCNRELQTFPRIHVDISMHLCCNIPCLQTVL